MLSSWSGCASHSRDLQSFSSCWCFLMFLLSTMLIRTSHGFANNLIGTEIGCMTELDTSEVIMNGVVKAADASEFPDIHLAVMLGENFEEMHHESPFAYRPDPGTSTVSLAISFVNPYSLGDFPEKNDLQFVIQLEDTSGGAPGVSASFVGGGSIGCEGNQRVSARYRDEIGQVQLQIHDVSASLKLWAGWATGQHAVQLTPTLVLEPGSEDGEPAQGNEVYLEEKGTTEGTEEEQNVAGEKGPKGNEGEGGDHDLVPKVDAVRQEDHGQIVTEDEDTVQKRKDKKIDHRHAIPLKKDRMALHKLDMREKLHDEKKRRTELGAHMERNSPDQKSFFLRYEKGVDLDSTSHLAASVFFILSMAGILFAFRKRRSKGHLL
jgi:hypothetical protein